MNQPRTNRDTGLQRAIRNARKRFRIPENTEYYSKKNFKQAEKKYIKLCVIGGRC